MNNKIFSIIFKPASKQEYFLVSWKWTNTFPPQERQFIQISMIWSQIDLRYLELSTFWRNRLNLGLLDNPRKND